MAKLSMVDKMKIEKLLGMESGYVLDFSNKTFSEFMFDSVGTNIWDTKFNYKSGSKANRLRAFWRGESDKKVGKLLNDILEYWKAQVLINGSIVSRNEKELYKDCLGIANKLTGETVINEPTTEAEFLKNEFKEISISALKLDAAISGILEQRLEEIKICLNSKAALATIFLCGSTLEGILLGVAANNPQKFNSAKSSPLDNNGKVLQFYDWTLNNFINVAKEIGFLNEDVKKFSHVLRDFRNYIHPFEQAAQQFNPDEHTAKLCWQVLRVAIFQITKYNLYPKPLSHK